jgi:recombinational DNA repair protein (RecF pathway)
MATFASGDLTAFVRPHRDLHTMKDFRCTRLRGGIGADMLRFAGASAVVELVLLHTEQESNPGLFSALEASLDSIEATSGGPLPTACLAGLWHIVEALGFAPQLDPCVVCGRPLEADAVGRFDLASGGVRCPVCGAGAAGPRVGPGARRQIAQLLQGRVDPPVTHARRHLGLVSDFVAYHVASTPMKSLDFLGGFLPPAED